MNGGTDHETDKWQSVMVKKTVVTVATNNAVVYTLFLSL